MSKVYQPIVIEEADNILQGLIESQFFIDYDITDYTYSKQYLLDLLTEKYINGLLDDDEAELFTEEEFEQILKELVAGTILYELKEKGYINSYEDENTEEMFFLTEEGKKYLANKQSFSENDEI